jgi:CrcB protein
MGILSVFSVGAGGAVGAVLRYLLSLIPFDKGFPLQTFGANVIGAVAIGIIAGLGGRLENKSLVLFLKTGVCGGFTTFSTFSLETVTLFQNGRYFVGTLYAAVTLAACMTGVVIGMKIGENL